MPSMTEERFKELLLPVFPKDAVIRQKQVKGGLHFEISWKLNNDPLRKNKRSKTIILIVSEETFEDHRDGDANERGKNEKLGVAKVTKLMSQFNPDHNTPYGEPVPEETWVV